MSKYRKIVQDWTSTSININLMKCPNCGTVYHWGSRGWGNCPHCKAVEETKKRTVKE